MTVSRVFDESGRLGRVRASTRAWVLKAARELGYRPHRAARALARRRSDLIGVLLPAFTGGFTSEVMDGVAAEAHRSGYHTTFALRSATGWDLRAALEHLLEQRVEGIVYYPASSAPVPDEATTEELRSLPVVLVDLDVEGLDLPLVTTDDANGIEQAVAHLVSLGHERIAHLGGPSHVSTAQVRVEAFREAMARRGLATPQEYVVRHQTLHSFADAAEAAGALLSVRPAPSAVIAWNDLVAAALLRVARERGVAAPAELAVVGFSDTLLCEMWSPKLTTVRQPSHAIGGEAVRVLLRLIAGQQPEGESRVRLLPTELVIRESCGYIASGAIALHARPEGLAREGGGWAPAGQVDGTLARAGKGGEA